MCWTTPLERPRLAVAAVDVWRAGLATGGQRERAVLAPEEQERAARFVRAEDGRRWAHARGILRALLARYLGADADPRELRFAAGPHGKPELVGGAADGPGGGHRLRFNLSHSGDCALYAFALDREVGVDVEQPRRPRDTLAIAERVLGAAEAARLRALDPAVREREFLRAWVRYEAVLKCRGTGIGAAAVEPEGPDPWVRELDVGAPAAAALAVAGTACEVHCWQWSPGG